MTSGDAILIESDGRKILVPTQAAFQRVLEENYKLKNQVNRLEAMIKSVNNSAKNIDSGLKAVENELRNKADKYS
jgi:predicted site-specific integrase-resolvase